ncbi:MAG: adenylate kinase [Acidobacteria bacterium]|nr:adenylate kinase [Acidobacteriota bacterium]
MSVILVMMGAPGAGKGTQAGLLSHRYGWPKISTGDILREMSKAETPVGRDLRRVQASGQLVSDEILAEIVKERTSREDCRDGYILDGFPRTVTQAELLLELSRQQGRGVIVVNFAIRPERLIERLSRRLSCPGCGEVYSLTVRAPRQPDRCDRCGSELTHRADDEPEAIARRLEVYQAQTEPLIGYFRDRKLLLEMQGEQPVNSLFEELVRNIESRVGRAGEISA